MYMAQKAQRMLEKETLHSFFRKTRDIIKIKLLLIKQINISHNYFDCLFLKLNWPEGIKQFSCLKNWTQKLKSRCWNTHAVLFAVLLQQARSLMFAKRGDCHLQNINPCLRRGRGRSARRPFFEVKNQE